MKSKLEMRIDKDLKVRIKQAAFWEGMDASSWCRKILNKAAERVEKKVGKFNKRR